MLAYVNKTDYIIDLYLYVKTIMVFICGEKNEKKMEKRKKKKLVWQQRFVHQPPGLISRQL